jgi:hypothetical protein
VPNLVTFNPEFLYDLDGWIWSAGVPPPKTTFNRDEAPPVAFPIPDLSACGWINAIRNMPSGTLIYERGPLDPYIPCAPGDVHTVSAYNLMGGPPAHLCKVSIRYFNAGLGLIGAAPPSANYGGAGAWERQTTTGTAPALTAWCDVLLQYWLNIGEWVRTTAWQLEPGPGPPGPYIGPTLRPNWYPNAW